jgi:uncharacterized protein YcnI
MKPSQAAAAALAVLATSGAAQAHIVFAETEAEAGAYYAGFLRVSHGCEGSPTTAIRVEIPDGVYTARPQPKPGWTLEIERETLSAPVAVEGGAITERVSAVTWRGELADELFDQFGLMLKLPETSGPLYFPAVQTCADGSQAWTEIPPEGQAWGSVPHPAPVVNLQGASAAAHDANAEHAGHGDH